MDGGVAQIVGNLGEIHVFLPDQLFGAPDFHLGEIVNNTAPAFSAEQFLKLGRAHQVVVADLFNGERLGQVQFHVIFQTFDQFVVLS